MTTNNDKAAEAAEEIVGLAPATGWQWPPVYEIAAIIRKHCDEAIATLTRERDEARAEMHKWRNAHAAAVVKLADLTRQREELLAALEKIAACWTPKCNEKIAEWEGSGTEAFEDSEFMDALSIKPLCEIAQEAIAKVKNGHDDLNQQKAGA